MKGESERKGGALWKLLMKQQLQPLCLPLLKARLPPIKALMMED